MKAFTLAELEAGLKTIVTAVGEDTEEAVVALGEGRAVMLLPVEVWESTTKRLAELSRPADRLMPEEIAAVTAMPFDVNGEWEMVSGPAIQFSGQLSPELSAALVRESIKWQVNPWQLMMNLTAAGLADDSDD